MSVEKLEKRILALLIEKYDAAQTGLHLARDARNRAGDVADIAANKASDAFDAMLKFKTEMGSDK